MQGNEKCKLMKNKYYLIAIFILFVALLGILFYKYDPTILLRFILDQNINPVLFIFLMVTLPIIGFPVSVFWVMVGIKFGILNGVILAAACMLIHMVSSYLLARIFLRAPIKRFLQKRGYELPPFSQEKFLPGIVLFLALPGLPYVLKNYVVALAEIPILSYILINWSVQGIFTFPIVVLGGAAAQRNWNLAIIFIVLIFVLFLFRWLYNKRKAK